VYWKAGVNVARQEVGVLGCDPDPDKATGAVTQALTTMTKGAGLITATLFVTATLMVAIAPSTGMEAFRRCLLWACGASLSVVVIYGLRYFCIK
jgi:hypothetical protein